MLGKLALRNVKRQIGNYIIYFLTVMLTIALMFALCNLIYSQQIMDYCKNMRNMKNGLIGISVFVAIIVSFVLGYASAFMLKLRKREFGTYLTLGMSRGEIILLFCAENILIGCFALGAGLVFGAFFFQGLTGLVAHLLDVKLSLATYSVTGLLLTVVLGCVIFLISTIISSIYLHHASIYHLLHADQKVSKITKHPVVWFVITILALIGIVISVVGANDMLKAMFGVQNTVYTALTKTVFSGQSDTYTSMFFLFLMFMLIFVMFFHIGLSKSLVNVLLKKQTFKIRGTNTFLLRQLSGQLGANAVLCGIIAVLITSSILGINVCFGQKATIKNYLQQQFPFDITVNLTQQKKTSLNYEDAKNVINQYARITAEDQYQIYISDTNDLTSHTVWTGEGYSGLKDTYIKESDFNLLLKKLGYEPIRLNQEYMVLSDSTAMKNADFSNVDLTIDGKVYKFKEMTDRYPSVSFEYFTTVIPDEAVEHMQPNNQYAVIDLDRNNFDAEGLRNRLAYTEHSNSGYEIERCNFYIRRYYEMDENSLAALLIVGSLYISIVFIFLAAAILTLKLLAGLPDDQRRYELLYRLGVPGQEQKKTLFWQTFVFFLIPFAGPFILSIPIAYACGEIVEFSGYHDIVAQMYWNAGAITVIMFAIFVLYFTATYLLQRKRIIYQNNFSLQD